MSGKHGYVVRGLVYGASFGALVGLAACDDRPDPLSPSEAGLSQQAVAGEPVDYYYHLEERVHVDVDPMVLVVASDAPDGPQAAADVLRRQGFGVAGTERLEVSGSRGHFRLRLSPGTGKERARSARGLLKADQRFDFVTPGYMTAGSDRPLVFINRLNVEFKPGVAQRQIDSLAGALDLRLERRARPDSAKFSYWFKYPRKADVDPLAVAAELHHHPLVLWASPDAVADISLHHTPTDPYYSAQYYLKNTQNFNGVAVDINVEPAWDLDYSLGGGVPSAGGLTVAVIDDGVQAAHPDMNVDFGYDVFGNNSWGCTGCAQDPDNNPSHGTAVAGIINGQHDGRTGFNGGIAGIAPGAYIAPIRIFRAAGGATDAQIADGINYAWYWAGAAVLNNSWGYTSLTYGGNTAVTTAISNANTKGRGGKGAVVIFSAGNTSERGRGITRGILYPAKLSTVLAVGAINRNGGPADYTPHGSQMDIVAPSGHYTGDWCRSDLGDVVTADLIDYRGCNDGPNGDLNYMGTFSGTSAAAPQVSGVATLILSKYPTLTSTDVKNRILNGADYWGSDSYTYGRGKLNALRALQ